MAIRVNPLDLGQSLMDYQHAWQLQRDTHAGVVSGELADQVILLEHSSVYTAGRRTEPADRPVDGTAVIDVDRGGKITWHGPGQLVGYPILHLPNPMDVVAHVRRIEEVLIGTCAEIGLETARIKGRSGVWVDGADGQRKLAAIGVRVAQGVTMHGFALNCSNTLTGFDNIVPCGIRDAGVSTLSLELGRSVTPLDVADILTAQLHRVFDSISAPSGNAATA